MRGPREKELYSPLQPSTCLLYTSLQPLGADGVLFAGGNHGLAPGAVSYTHLDVYKRQVYDRSGYARWDSDRGSFYVSGNLELNMDGLDPRSDDALIRQDHITVSLVNPRPLDASLWSALLDEM